MKQKKKEKISFISKLMNTTIHGDRTQKQISEAVQQFKNRKCQILVATSIAAMLLIMIYPIQLTFIFIVLVE